MIAQPAPKPEIQTEAAQPATSLPRESVEMGREHEAPLKAGNLGAVLIVPPEELDLDPPFCLAEIQPRSGEHVIHGGVDYTLEARLLCQALGAAPVSKDFEIWDNTPLREFADAANRADFQYCNRLLALLQRAKNIEKTSFTDFHRWLAETQEYNGTSRTLRRQTNHAALGLILAAIGLVDKVPSQNVSNTICAMLPRSAWVPFIKSCSTVNFGREAAKSRIVAFARSANIPLRGEPAAGREVRHRPGNPAAMLPPQPQRAATSMATKPKKTLHRKRLAFRLSHSLAGVIPASRLIHPEAFAQTLVQNLSRAAKVPRPARHAKLQQLFADISSLDARFAEEIETAALLRFLAVAVDAAHAGAKKTPQKAKTQVSQTL